MRTSTATFLPFPEYVVRYERIFLLCRRGTFATVKEGTNKETKARVAIKIIDKKDTVFDAESLAQEVMSHIIVWSPE